MDTFETADSEACLKICWKKNTSSCTSIWFAISRAEARRNDQENIAVTKNLLTVEVRLIREQYSLRR